MVKNGKRQCSDVSVAARRGLCVGNIINMVAESDE